MPEKVQSARHCTLCGPSPSFDLFEFHSESDFSQMHVTLLCGYVKPVTCLTHLTVTISLNQNYMYSQPIIHLMVEITAPTADDDYHLVRV